jgi:quercetin dioxygenase-like cupin family protein
VKLIVTLAALAAVAVLPIAAQAPAVIQVNRDKVAEALTKGGSIVTAANLSVSGIRRTEPGQVEVHDRETDIFYVTEGEGTIVTGGTMIGGKQTAPGQQRGTDIQGGETRRLQQGEVIVIPAGVPHWFKTVSPTINYLTVKVIAPS